MPETTPDKPYIADTATITISVRFDTQGHLDAHAQELLDKLPGKLTHALGMLLARKTGVHLAGINVDLPDFKPYGPPPAATKDT